MLVSKFAYSWKLMNTLGNHKKIKRCTHKDTYNSAANYFRLPLLVPNNAKSLHFYQIVHLTHFLTFSRINIYQNIRNEKILETLKGCTYKITHMSVASYPILKKPRTKVYHSVFFFLFNVFLYIHETSKWDHLYNHHRYQLLFGTMVGSPGHMAAEI